MPIHSMRLLTAGVSLLAVASLHAAELNDRDKAFIAYAEPTIAFVHANVIDGTGGKVKSDQTLVIDKGRIAALGASRKVKVPKGATLIDAQGKTLLPGFVMMHEHMFYPAGELVYNELIFSFPRLYLAGGTTTMRTAGTMMPYADLNVRDAIAGGAMIGPDMDVTGPYLNGPGLPIAAVHALTGVDDTDRTVNYWADEGVTSYKAYMQITRAELQRAIEIAHRRGSKVTAHLCSVTYREAVNLGIDDLEHGFFVGVRFRQGQETRRMPRCKSRHAHACGTRSRFAGSEIAGSIARRQACGADVHAHGVRDLRHRPSESVAGSARPDDSGSPPAVRDDLCLACRRRPIRTGSPRTRRWRSSKRCSSMQAAPCSMAPTPPVTAAWCPATQASARSSCWCRTAASARNRRVRISTLNGATYLGRDKEIGTLEVGKRADVLVIDGDPSKDVAAIEKMPLVFKNGVGYDTAKIFAAMKETVGLH